MTRGVVYVAYGEPARREMAESLRTLRERNPRLGVCLISDEPLPDVQNVAMEDTDPGARWPKLHVDVLSPYDDTLYLDADTRVWGDLSPGFDLLDDGWELVMVPSVCQGGTYLWHLTPEDRDATFRELGHSLVQLQGGMMLFRKCEAIHTLFSRWREEWLRFKSQDQGALLRALYAAPVRLWLLGRPWNGGALVAHKYGRAKRFMRDEAKMEFKLWRRENQYLMDA